MPPGSEPVWLFSCFSNGCPQDDWSAEREAVHWVLFESDKRPSSLLAKRFLSDGLSGLALYRCVNRCASWGYATACLMPGSAPWLPPPRPGSARLGAARDTRRFLAEWARDSNVRLSCGRAGYCRDNAVADSFFAMLKNEMHCRRSFATRADARHAMVKFVEAYRNRRRSRSTIDCKAPAEAATAFFGRADFKTEGMLKAA